MDWKSMAISPLRELEPYPDEHYIEVKPGDFHSACLALHKALASPVMMLSARDERSGGGVFVITCMFLNVRRGKWVFIDTAVAQEDPWFESLAKEIYSAALFEREIYEMFGIEPRGNPDLRRLRLHDEVWPQGNFPLRKDFGGVKPGRTGDYIFTRVEGEGIFEVPVGPVHAGIIGPGHFRFSAAGEPIIQLEGRLGFTHRGAEKIFEGVPAAQALRIAGCISGDSCVAHALACAMALEKIGGGVVSGKAALVRAIFLELERMYNHVNDIGGMAVDTAFSFPAAYASMIKETLLQLNEKLSGSRYLKDMMVTSGVAAAGDIDAARQTMLVDALRTIRRDFRELTEMLFSSVSFMDRVDATGVLKRKTAADLGVVGVPARACGIASDMRKFFPGVYQDARFRICTQESGDVLARLRVRCDEFLESARLIEEFVNMRASAEKDGVRTRDIQGAALGYAEGWRGPVLYWIKTDLSGNIERCKIVDPSFHNWQALSYAVLGNIIPDFPLCNKSFDLSYSGNDL